MFAFAMFISCVLTVDVIVMLCVYVISFTGACGIGVSDVYVLNNVGDRTPISETPVLNWRCIDVLFLNVVYALRPLMWFAMNLRIVCGMFGEFNV